MIAPRHTIATSTSPSMKPVNASPAIRKRRCRAGRSPRLARAAIRHGIEQVARRWRRAGRWHGRFELGSARSLSIVGRGWPPEAAGSRLPFPLARRPSGRLRQPAPDAPTPRENRDNSARPCRISCSERHGPGCRRAPRRRRCTGFAIRAGQDHRHDRPGLRRLRLPRSGSAARRERLPREAQAVSLMALVIEPVIAPVIAPGTTMC